MEHMINYSDWQRFAFVGGPRGDLFSKQREEIFRSMLSEHGYQIDEKLFVSGNYNAFDAYDLVTELLQEQSGIDAIVAANDTIALSAARAVTAAGLSIPSDLIVTGFDDVPDATRHSPALTTVRQPLTEMAEVAIAKLLYLITGPVAGRRLPGSTDGRLTLASSELVIRGSTASMTTASNIPEDVEAHARLLAGMVGLKTPVEIDLEQLSRELEHTLCNGSRNLAQYLAKQAEHVNLDNTHWWSNLCHQLELLSRTVLLENHTSDRMVYIIAALACINERIWAAEMEREFASRRLNSMRLSMRLQISSSTDSNELMQALEKWIFAIKPQRLFLVQYDEPSTNPKHKGQLVCAVRKGNMETVTDSKFVTEAVLPREFVNELGHGTLLLNPVYAGFDHYGYLIVDPKGLDVSELASAAQSIGNAMRSQYLIETLQLQAARLRDANVGLSELANRDALPGLPNRLCFERRLFDLCQQGENQTRFALCFLDLDGFKEVNDQYGHECGDALLRKVAERLSGVVSNILGEQGFVARLGGDEFTVIVETEQLHAELEQLIPALLEVLSAPYSVAGHVSHVSASIGIAIHPEHGEDTRTLLKHADDAMYEAKQSGKNCSVLYRNDVTDSTDLLPIKQYG